MKSNTNNNNFPSTQSAVFIIAHAILDGKK